MYQINEASALSGVTVRALRHYDAIGLLSATRSDAGYRLYSRDDIQMLRTVRRYQSFGFALDEIKELLRVSAAERLAALRRQRDAVRQRVADSAGIVHAINREIAMENGGGSVPPDRLGRAQALVSGYLKRSKSEGVSRWSPLLAEAVDVLRPLTTGPSMDAAAVRFAAWIHHLRHDPANLADLCQRFLDQGPDWEDRAYATQELISALTLLERHRDGVDMHRAHIEQVVAQRPAAEWADSMYNSTHLRCWAATGRRTAWVELFRTIDAGVEATPENRASRYELLHTAVMAMGAESAEYGDEIGELTQRMAGILAEDPHWSERLWAEQRLWQQKIGNAVRRGDPDAITQAVDAYRSFLDRCDWPVDRIGAAYSNLGAIMHWDRRHEQALDCFARALEDGELDGYGYAWFAAAALASGTSRERVTELLAEAGRRLEAADAMRVFNEDAVLSAAADKEDLLNALLPRV